jgi:hypothetical protein
MEMNGTTFSQRSQPGYQHAFPIPAEAKSNDSADTYQGQGYPVGPSSSSSSSVQQPSGNGAARVPSIMTNRKKKAADEKKKKVEFMI